MKEPPTAKFLLCDGRLVVMHTRVCETFSVNS